MVKQCLTKEPRILKRGKMVSLVNGAGKIGYSQVKE